jgi:hypothetical protein
MFRSGGSSRGADFDPFAEAKVGLGVAGLASFRTMSIPARIVSVLIWPLKRPFQLRVT